MNVYVKRWRNIITLVSAQIIEYEYRKNKLRNILGLKSPNESKM